MSCSYISATQFFFVKLRYLKYICIDKLGLFQYTGPKFFFLFGTILMRHSRVNISKPEKIETVRHHKVL